MWEIPAMALFAGASLGFGIWRARERMKSWQQAAVACGLQEVRTEFLSTLRARAGPLDVVIEKTGERFPRTRIVVFLPRSTSFRHVVIRPQSLLPWARDIEIGDSAFDGAFTLKGPPRLVFSLLDAETRRLLITLNALSQLQISDGSLEVIADHKRVGSLLPILLKVGERFLQALADPRRLAEIAAKDPAKEVRLRSLQLMIRELPGDAMTADAIRDACSDPSPEIRLRAALELGPAGRALLHELAESTVDDECSAQAVRALDRDLPYERVSAVFYDALGKRLIKTAKACLETLGSTGSTAAVHLLTIVVEVQSDELAAVAALALGTTGDPHAERPLVRALERESLEVRIAAATALSHVGSATAVLPLKEAANRPPSSSELRKATRQAIAEIQSRLQGAAPGQLSLAGQGAGQLSLAEGDAGKLSLASDATGRLSMPAEETELLGPPVPGPPLPKGEEGEGRDSQSRFPLSPLGREGPGE